MIDRHVISTIGLDESHGPMEQSKPSLNQIRSSWDSALSLLRKLITSYITSLTGAWTTRERQTCHNYYKEPEPLDRQTCHQYHRT